MKVSLYDFFPFNINVQKAVHGERYVPRNRVVGVVSEVCVVCLCVSEVLMTR